MVLNVALPGYVLSFVTDTNWLEILASWTMQKSKHQIAILFVSLVGVLERMKCKLAREESCSYSRSRKNGAAIAFQLRTRDGSNFPSQRLGIERNWHPPLENTYKISVHESTSVENQCPGAGIVILTMLVVLWMGK